MFTKSKLPGTSKNSNEYMETDDKFSSDKIILKSSSSNIEIGKLLVLSILISFFL